MLNANNVIIFDLSSLGEMAQITFGRFLMSSIKSIVRNRSKPSDHHTYCFIDEVQNFVGGKSESFEYILSQLRGFGLHMVMANQYPEQLGNNLKAVIQNTAVKMLVEGSSFDLFDIGARKIELSKYEFLLKVRGAESQIFKSADTMLLKPDQFYLSKLEEEHYRSWTLDNFYKPLQKISKITLNDDSPTQEIVSPNDNFDYTIYIGEDG